MNEIPLILLITLGFGFALVFGLVTNRLGLSPIVGYLLAGIAVGPHTPGFVGNQQLAGQLAEIGVILLMFGVGLRFDVRELFRVRSIAIPGSIAQMGAAVLLSLLLIPMWHLAGSTAVVLGVAVSVASTVVLVRVLMDNRVLHTPQGHVAMGWLVVQDLFAVTVLVVMPAMKAALASGEMLAVGEAVALAALRIAGALLTILVVGRRVLPWLLGAVARTRSRELFSLCVLAVALLVAVGSAEIFGASMALGAFLAGLVIAQSEVSHQAGSETLPLRDAFAVLFFVSVGMLFDPSVLVVSPGLTASVLCIILLGTPLAAFTIVTLLNHPVRTALTVAIGLSQIGEFSFILGHQARQLGYFDQRISSVLVACAIISIGLNPILFRLVPYLERVLARIPGLGSYLVRRGRADPLAQFSAAEAEARAPRAIVVGFGPVGQAIVARLEEVEIPALVIDLNVDTVRRLREVGKPALYGDAQSALILRSAGVSSAEILVVTTPDPDARGPIIDAAREVNPGISILVRSRFSSEQGALERRGVSVIVCEEDEVAFALAQRLIEHFSPAATPAATV